MKMSIERIDFPLASPFVITGYTFTTTPTVRVTLEENGFCGRGEGVGVYYTGDTIEKCIIQLGSVKAEVEQGLTFEKIQHLLPAGGARNALDCAYWDLQAKQQKKSIWDLLKMTPKPLRTVCTLSIGSADEMAAAASAREEYPYLKIKLDNDDPISKLQAIRAARPDANLIIDVNQGWTIDELKYYAPECAKLDVAMIEQPLKRGEDAALKGFRSPVLLGGDESCLTLSEYKQVAQYYDVINIKLDKCGGLTEGLAIANQALLDRKGLMVGNMTGTSLSMAASFVIGQYCQFVDIDGPLLLASDIEDGLTYRHGLVTPPTQSLWG